MSDEPEEGFTFRDRRRVHVDESSPAPAPTPSAAPEPVVAPSPGAGSLLGNEEDETLGGYEGDDEGYDGEAPGEIPDVYTVLMLFLGELRNLAWLRMGLVPNPATGELDVDLQQAKVAIDTVGFLAEQIDPVVAPEERLPLKAMVSDLRIRFVEQARAASGGS